MYRSFLLAAALAALLQARAQNQVVHQVFALSEGYYDFFGGAGQLVPVTLGVFNPDQGTYATVATLNGPRFGSDVLVDGGSVYVAADDRVIRFDADSYAEQAEVLVAGVRKLAVWNELLLLTRGELGGLSHYFEARDKNSLDLLWTIDPADGLTQSAEDVLVVGDMAYLAVSDAFNWSGLVGKVGVVDLVAQVYLDEVNLGPDGLNPERLFVKDGDIIAFNNTDFTRSTISRVNAGSATLDYTVTVASNSGCAASTLVEALDKVYFLEYAQAELARFDVDAAVVIDTLVGSPAIYGLIEDPINGLLYATTTDFFAAGELHVMNFEGAVQATVPVAVGIGNLALDLRLSTAIANRAPSAVTLFPNPADDEVGIRTEAPVQRVEVLDAMGRVVLRAQFNAATQQRIQVAHLSPGVYSVRADGSGVGRFTKR